MIRRALVTWVVVAVAVAVAATVVPGIEIRGGLGALLWVALLFGLVNAVLGPLLHLLSLPLTVLTLGLFALVVNAALLAITAGLSSHLDVGGFLSTMIGALVVSVVSAALQLLLRPVSGAGH